MYNLIDIQTQFLSTIISKSDIYTSHFFTLTVIWFRRWPVWQTLLFALWSSASSSSIIFWHSCNLLWRRETQRIHFIWNRYLSTVLHFAAALVINKINKGGVCRVCLEKRYLYFTLSFLNAFYHFQCFWPIKFILVWGFLIGCRSSPTLSSWFIYLFACAPEVWEAMEDNNKPQACSKTSSGLSRNL